MLCIHANMTSRFYYENISLNRSLDLKLDDNWLSSNSTAKNIKIIPVWRNQSLISTGTTPNDNPIAAILSGNDADVVRKSAKTLVFLGLKDDVIYCAADLSHLDNPHSTILPKETRFEDLRRLASSIDPIKAGYLAYARAIIHWHQGNQFCGVCGHQTKLRRGGHERFCLNSKCGKSHFPRIDPAVIMLVIHPKNDKCLLGYNKKFQGIRYSTIAGFVEPAETLEQAVTREVFEETNIQTVDVTYKASQPWPFPASIMLGFRARAITTEIICNDKELIEAKWFSRTEVIKMSKNGETLPPANLSISRWLIDCWLSEK